MYFGKFSNLSKPLTCTRSITSGLPLKGIFEHIWIVHFFLWEDFNSRMLLSWNICSISIFWFTIGTLRWAVRTISIKQAPPTSNCNILTQIINNLFGRNTTGFTWKRLQNDNWITHMDYFERVEQMLISLLKTCEYMIIKIYS